MTMARGRKGEVSGKIVRAIRTRVRAEARRRADRVEERAGRYWTAWRSRRGKKVFAEIRSHRTGIEVFILPPPWALEDGAGLARRAPPTQGWGWFRTRFHVTSFGEVPAATRLILQSYEIGRRGRNGRGGRREERA